MFLTAISIACSSTLTIYYGGMPSTNMIDSIKVYYGSQLKSYTNSISFPVNTLIYITNAPFNGYNPIYCRGEYMPFYTKLPISGLISGQPFYYKMSYIWKGGSEVLMWESMCASTVPTNDVVLFPPTNLRIVD